MGLLSKFSRPKKGHGALKSSVAAKPSRTNSAPPAPEGSTQKGRLASDGDQGLTMARKAMETRVDDLIARAAVAPSVEAEASSDARQMQSALGKEFEVTGLGEKAPIIDGVIENEPEVAPKPLPKTETEDEMASPSAAVPQQASGNDHAVSAQTRKPSRAALDLENMKKAPDLSAMVRKEVVAGTIVIGLFCLFFFGWAAVAPLSSAAIAPGVISPEGNRKTVQHLEGGIIEKILIEDGSQVKAGEPLILLEDTMARASYSLIRTQYFTLAARQARLAALQSGSETIYFADWLTAEADDIAIAAILATEGDLLASRRLAHNDRKAVLQNRIGQLEKEIEGLQAQITGQTRQLALIGEEIDGVKQLVDKGLERKPRLLGLQRTEAEIRAGRGANTALIAKTGQAISATELELIASDTVLQDEVAREMAEVQAQLSAAGQRMGASGDILNRIKIVAPVSGKVIGLNFHTAGGIIAPGAAILDIVPEDGDLIVEARVSPMDIDVVYEGLEAQVHLSAFAQRNMPMIQGTVRHVSADRLVDQVTGQPYFLATVAISDEEVSKIGDNVTLMAGMPAEVMIITGEQTLLGYIIQPAISTLRHSFREG